MGKIFKEKQAIIFSFSILLLLLLVASASAAGPEVVELPNPLGTTSVSFLIGRIIKGFLGVTGAVAMTMFIYGGLAWLTSGGSPDKIKKGKDVLLWSAVGLAIIFSSYLLVDFVIKGIVGPTQKGTTTTDAVKFTLNYEIRRRGVCPNLFCRRGD